jgi:ribosomal protein L40E
MLLAKLERRQQPQPASFRSVYAERELLSLAVDIGLRYLIKITGWIARGFPSMPAERKVAEDFRYPTGMVWCPMKMSGMAILKCARLQKELGCGTRRELHAIQSARPERFMLFWPWLRNRGDCPERATNKQVRDVLLAITPLKLAQRSSKNLRTSHCSGCGGRKIFGARQCRRCWLVSVKKGVPTR